jgi:hypothetical protein
MTVGILDAAAVHEAEILFRRGIGATTGTRPCCDRRVDRVAAIASSIPVVAWASGIGRVVKVWKRGRSIAITWIASDRTMQAVSSLEKFGFFCAPSAS